MRVLIVEDDPLVGDAVRRALTNAGFAADLVGSAESARSALQVETFDLAVVDIGLPRGERLATTARAAQPRQDRPRPDADRAGRPHGPGNGARSRRRRLCDQAVPGSRNRGALPRADPARERRGESTRVTFGNLEVDMAHREVSVGGELLSLTQREWAILECFVLNAGRLVSKDKLLSAIAGWSDDARRTQSSSTSRDCGRSSVARRRFARFAGWAIDWMTPQPHSAASIRRQLFLTLFVPVAALLVVGTVSDFDRLAATDRRVRPSAARFRAGHRGPCESRRPTANSSSRYRPTRSPCCGPIRRTRSSFGLAPPTAIHRRRFRSPAVACVGAKSRKRRLGVSRPTRAIVSYRTLAGNDALTVTMGETTHKRMQTRNRILTSALATDVALLSAILVLIWVGVRVSLEPLRSVGAQIAQRSARDLTPLAVERVPTEIRRIVIALNRLFSLVSENAARQRQFLDNAAHQLRTPLAGIQAQLELLCADEPAIPQRERLQRILDGARRLGHTTQQLLILARADESASPAWDFEEVDLASIVESIVMESIVTAGEQGIDLGAEVREATVPGVGWLLAEALRSLANNALAHTPAGGSVTLGCGSHAGAPYVEVVDTGVGIPTNERTHVRERFFRASNAHGLGSGLGLAIVDEVTQLHRGQLTIDSGPNGKGTAVRISFPPAGSVLAVEPAMDDTGAAVRVRPAVVAPDPPRSSRQADGRRATACRRPLRTARSARAPTDPELPRIRQRSVRTRRHHRVNASPLRSQPHELERRTVFGARLLRSARPRSRRELARGTHLGHRARGRRRRASARADDRRLRDRGAEAVLLAAGRAIAVERRAAARRKVTARSRICVVVAEQHARWWRAPLAALPRANVIVQPRNCGTAVGLLLPLLHVLERDSQARIAVLPSDHYVRDEDVLAEALERSLAALREPRHGVVLLGMAPDEADPELGYIEPEPGTQEVLPIARFVEKPRACDAEALIEHGALWNSFIVAARGAALARLFTRHDAGLVSRLHAAVRRDAHNYGGASAISSLYRTLPHVDFSRDVLQHCVASLAVARVPPCGWTDLGTPERLGRTLRMPVSRRAIGGSVFRLRGQMSLERQHAEACTRPITG